MNWFRNLKLGAKLWLMGGTVLVLMLTMGILGLQGASSINVIARDLATKDVPRMGYLGKIVNDMRNYRTLQLRYLIRLKEKDAAGAASVKQNMDKALAEIQTDYDDYKRVMDDSRIQAEVEKLQSVWAEYRQISDPGLALAEQGKLSEAFRIVDTEGGKFFLGSVSPVFDAITEWEFKHGEENVKAAADTYAAVRAELFGLLGFAFLIALALIVFTTRMISAETQKVLARLQSLEANCMTGVEKAMVAFAAGDLTIEVTPKTTPIENPGKDEIGQIATLFNSVLTKTQSVISAYSDARLNMVAMLNQVQASAATVTQTSTSLGEASEQAGMASGDIAGGSEKLARSATEVAATMDELVGKIQTVAAMSQQQAHSLGEATGGLNEALSAAERVSESSEQMAKIAETGNDAVNQTVTAMQSIREQVSISSGKVMELDAKGQQIGNIVATIEQIAEQTNLLALNAAIEAARAGEHGRGFAVVADEVRKLAEQAGAATKEISTLIESVRSMVGDTVNAIQLTNDQVENGASQTIQAGEALAMIVQSAQAVADEAGNVTNAARRVADMMSEVRSMATQNENASILMSTGAEQVSHAISEVAAISEEASAGAQELSASVEEVSASASELSRMANDLDQMVAKFKLTNENTRGSNLRIAA